MTKATGGMLSLRLHLVSQDGPVNMAFCRHQGQTQCQHPACPSVMRLCVPQRHNKRKALVHWDEVI